MYISKDKSFSSVHYQAAPFFDVRTCLIPSPTSFRSKPASGYPRWLAVVSRGSHQTQPYNFLLTNSLSYSVLFFGLNLVRLISILSFILVLAGSFFVMVTDIISVNKFRKESREPGKSAEGILAGCDYIRLRIA